MNSRWLSGDVLDEVFDGILDDLNSYHVVYCEACDFRLERWSKDEARIAGLAHEEDNFEHATVLQRTILTDRNHPELGFGEPGE